MFKQLFCKHDYKFGANIHGDMIDVCGGDRSTWTCSKCGKAKSQESLVDTEYIQDLIDRSSVVRKGKLSDGYHTFDDLYYHRMILFSVVCNSYKDNAWKSKLHDDGSMFSGYFIVGVTTSEGEFTYHYKLEYWDMFDVKELDRAPKWDGHTSEDIVMLLNI